MKLKKKIFNCEVNTEESQHVLLKCRGEGEGKETTEMVCGAVLEGSTA